MKWVIVAGAEECGRAVAEEGRGHGSQCWGQAREKSLGSPEGRQETWGEDWAGVDKTCFLVLEDSPSPGAEGLQGPEQRTESSKQMGAEPGEDGVPGWRRQAERRKGFRMDR